MKFKNSDIIKSTSQLFLKISESEFLRLFILFLLVAYTYSFFMTSRYSATSSDSRWYLYFLHDALLQFQQGIFPHYVGQSVFAFFGTPSVRAPYYLMFGGLLDFLTFHHFNALFIQHLTVLVSAFAGAFLSYFLMTRLAPTLRWYAVALSFLYISCPGVMGEIFVFTTYHAFMTVPYIPIVIYGLIRTYQTENFFSCIITAAALSLIYMTHPPIALWVTAICIIFYLLWFLFTGPSKRKFLLPLLTFSLLLLLCLWQFTSIFSLNLANEYVGNLKADFIVTILKSDLPYVFLPLGWKTGGTTPFIQLGYALWLIIFYGLIQTAYNLHQSIVRILLVCVLFIVLLNFPWPFTQFLWNIIPQIIKNTACPMQRVYFVLPVLACFIGILTLKHKFTFTLCLFVLCIWNIGQIQYFFQVLQNSQNDVTSTLSSKLVAFQSQYLSLSSEAIQERVPEGYYDPMLEVKLLDSEKLPIDTFDNKQIVIKKCFGDKIEKQAHLKPLVSLNHFVFSKATESESFAEINLSAHKKYFFCFQPKYNNLTSVFLVSSGFTTIPYIDINQKIKIVVVPFYSSVTQKSSMYIQRPNPETGTLEIKKMGITTYSANDYAHLPIQIISFIPFKATVNTNKKDTYLSLSKLYLQGYQAIVNGSIVPVLQTENHQVMIPLKSKGLNRIELVYIGTKLMRITFCISSIAWLTLIGYFIFVAYQQSTKKGG